ncbi:hypothetical protein TREMEDRAFT_63705 [Tremella mesenterica DSM 1558]|uniref:uncharacterized protein n=1 Tax=Tremella mesenterica (strain ATCC 24925 / CBS 8224 / DSM 1558 / NBRC 9311 / NRRL Y-6157 / RJB 2259-6 / UBC 559-6) TaxID=578456 RepID=UPI0003F492CA|nr:uncharacterized protein TREMEDRAFT_63705 [Tremella mesenterica DSM 1558]EIW67814.1 hypothetical protein TREMEDRAFT_63705 [Tremella mesenterica DSM 1558]
MLVLGGIGMDVLVIIIPADGTSSGTLASPLANQSYAVMTSRSVTKSVRTTSGSRSEDPRATLGGQAAQVVALNGPVQMSTCESTNAPSFFLLLLHLSTLHIGASLFSRHVCIHIPSEQRLKHISSSLIPEWIQA